MSSDTPVTDKIDKKSTLKDEPPMWLIGYNLLSGCLWSFVLLNVIATHISFGFDFYRTFQLTHWWTTIIQCFAVVEIYNSAMGIVRSPILTTTMQVLSRLLVVIGVWTIVPYAPNNYSYAYLTVHIAWSLSEVIRYYYYAQHLISQQTQIKGQTPNKVSPLLLWLRYNAFIILYPLGITSELIMIWSAAFHSKSSIYGLFLLISMVAYIPGAPVLFSHMLVQRKKFLGNKITKKTE